MRKRRRSTPSVPRRPLRALAAAALLCALLGSIAPGALAIKPEVKEEFAPFLDCPTATAGQCAYSETTAGEFVMGNKHVPIAKPIVLQGGLEQKTGRPLPLIPARDGNTLTSPPQKVPGGLLGIGLLEGIGGEVTATATIAGPATGVLVNQLSLIEGGGVAVQLPLKIKLDNPAWQRMLDRLRQRTRRPEPDHGGQRDAHRRRQEQDRQDLERHARRRLVRGARGEELRPQHRAREPARRPPRGGGPQQGGA